MTPRVDRPLNLLADKIKRAAGRRTSACSEWGGRPCDLRREVPEETESPPEVEGRRWEGGEGGGGAAVEVGS